MWLFFIFLGIGITIGLLNLIPKKYLGFNTIFQRIGIVLLLFSMGASIGSNKKMFSQIKNIGIKSFCFALMACSFSVLVTYFITKRFLKEKQS